MYGLSAEVYDALYSFKNYEEESQKVCDLIRKHKASSGVRLLDVACGTGSHLAHLEGEFQCAGVEPAADMRARAQSKLPFVTFHEGDMRWFDLKESFDIVLCLFSAIGYMKDLENLALAAQNMTRHLAAGGALIVEPWLSPDAYRGGNLHASFVDRPDLKVARMVKGEKEGRLSIMDMHHLVATDDGVRHFVERHEMGLFTKEEYLGAFTQEGCETIWMDEGLMTGRGLVIVKRELSRKPEGWSHQAKTNPSVPENQGAFDF